MLTKTLALVMLSAAFSAPSWADWERGRHHGRVIRVEPVASIRLHDGPAHFQILHEFGGRRYWTYSDYRPGPWIVVPAPRSAYPYRGVERDHHRWGGSHDHDGRWDDGHSGDRHFRGYDWH
ncbi:MAG: hypothetical protein WBX11_05940 [Thiobacillaceae bacterium]|jgi:hypothetical protein